MGDHLAGLGSGDAAGEEVEDLVVFDSGVGGAVGALDLVGVDFEAGEGVGFRVVGEEEVVAGLVGVGEVGALFDIDHAGEGGFRAVQKGVAVEEVAAGPGDEVVLVGALVVFLGSGGDGGGEHVGFRAFAEEFAGAFLSGP